MKKSAIRTIQIGKDISWLQFLKTRFVTPKELLKGLRDPAVPNKSIGAVLFNARYNALKAIDGYDFFTYRYN